MFRFMLHKAVRWSLCTDLDTGYTAAMAELCHCQEQSQPMKRHCWFEQSLE